MFQHYFSTFTFIPLPDSIATLIRFLVICACNYVAPCIVVFVYIGVINNIRAGAQSTLLNAQWSRQYCKTIVCWEQCVTTSEGYQQDTKDNQWCTRLNSILWRIWVNMCLHPVAPCIVVFRYIDVINKIRAGGQSNSCTRHNSILWRIWSANMCLQLRLHIVVFKYTLRLSTKYKRGQSNFLRAQCTMI